MNMANSQRKNIVVQYFEEYDKLYEKYGNRLVLLFQVGDFYETWDYDNEDGTKYGNAIVLHELFNYEYDFSFHPKTDVRKPVGFKKSSGDKNVSLLANAGYIVAIYNERDVVGKKYKKRVLDEIITPVTNFEGTHNNQYLMVMYIIEYKCVMTKRKRRNSYICMIDYTTGEVKMMTTYDTRDNYSKNNNDIMQWIDVYNPIEIVIISNDVSKEILLKEFRLDDTKQYIGYFETDSYYFHKDYIEKTLNIVYKDIEKIDRDQLLNIEKELLYTFIHTIQYTYTINPHIIEKLQYPKIHQDKDYLKLNNQTIFHLDVFSKTSPVNLFKLCDNTYTPMGKRLLLERFRHPLIEPSEIVVRYDKIDELTEYIEPLSNELKRVVDIEKKMRKMLLNKLKPNEFHDVYYSLIRIQNIMELLKQNIITKPEPKRKLELNTFLKYIESIFNIDELKSYVEMGRNIFKNEYNKELKKEFSKIQHKKDMLQIFADKMNTKLNVFLKSKKTYVQVKKHNKVGYYLSITPHKFKSLQGLYRSPIKFETYSFDIKSCMTDKTSSEVKLFGHDVTKLSMDIEKQSEELMFKINELFLQTMQTIIGKYKDLMHYLIDWISDIDVSVSGAILKTKYGYTRPIIDINDPNPFIDAKNVRHPIIERMGDLEFIPNDVSIGKQSVYGNIIYGLNASGKSVYIKSIGCNLILAQIGYFVCAERFDYFPFSQIVSRIPQGDDIFRGKSTFEVELEEMFVMFHQSQPSTLILSDELGSSTEAKSSSALVQSMVYYFLEKKCRFFMATHIHELRHEFESNPSIEIYSFLASIQNGTIKYERKLTKNGISDTYGLEMAEQYGFPKEIMKRAYSIRDKERILVQKKKSKYNSKIIVDKCSECGTRKDLHTHHIHEQSQSNEYGLIENRFHKNNKFNLMILCKDCHEKHHNHSK